MGLLRRRLWLLLRALLLRGAAEGGAAAASRTPRRACCCCWKDKSELLHDDSTGEVEPNGDVPCEMDESGGVTMTVELDAWTRSPPRKVLIDSWDMAEDHCPPNRLFLSRARRRRTRSHSTARK